MFFQNSQLLSCLSFWSSKNWYVKQISPPKNTYILICPNYMFSFFYEIISKLSDVWLFMSSKKLGCLTHIMSIDPKFFLHKTYSKFRLSENMQLVWWNRCSFDHFILWLSDLWRILKIVLSDLTPKKGPRVRSDTKQNLSWQPYLKHFEF